MSIKALGRAEITGTIKLISGLHIGAGKDTIEIGGIDNAVVKHPHTGHPYIPGSSLKGKLRSLLEWAFDKLRHDGQPWGFDKKDLRQTFDAEDAVLRIFGTPGKRQDWSGGPTRLIVRDAPLVEAWIKEITVDRGLDLTEEKVEVVIDRIAGKALHGVGPRRMERVPAGASFTFEMVFRLYDTGDGGARDKACLNWLLQGLHLLEQDALGGSGSRGYGRVSFEDLAVTFDGTRHEVRHRINAPFSPTEPPSIVAL